MADFALPAFVTDLGTVIALGIFFQFQPSRCLAFSLHLFSLVGSSHPIPRGDEPQLEVESVRLK